MIKVYYLEDYENTAGAVKEYLRQKGYEAFICDTSAYYLGAKRLFKCDLNEILQNDSLV